MNTTFNSNKKRPYIPKIITRFVRLFKYVCTILLLMPVYSVRSAQCEVITPHTGPHNGQIGHFVHYKQALEVEFRTRS